MAAKRRIAVQIVAAGLGALAVMAGLWIAAGAYLLAEYDQAASVLTITDQIEGDVQQARRWEKNFLLNDIRTATFHQSVADGAEPMTRSLREHAIATASLSQHIAALQPLLNDPLLTDELGSNAAEYAESFQAIVNAHLERGFQDWGLVGRWREAAHEIESAAEQHGDANLQIELLALRRNEKDYLLRGGEYEEAVYQHIERLRRILEASGDPSTMLAAVDRYAEAFQAHIEVDSRIGLTEGDGLRADMRAAAQAIEAVAGTLTANAQATESRVRRDLIIASLLIGLVGVAFAATLILWRARIITRPLADLQRSAQRFGRGELETRVQVDERNEVGALADAFNTMTGDLQHSEKELEQKNATLAEQLEQLAGLCRMLEDQARVIESDLERAAVIQHALLPQTPPQLDGWTSQALYRPGTQVGGDYYDVIHLGVRYFAIVIADAAGHGVAAAMLSVLFKQSIRPRDMEGLRSPARVLASANKQMCADVSAPGVFVTAAYALVDRREGSVRIASAGHPPCIHVKADGATTQVLRTGPALGLSKDASYDEVIIQLDQDERLLLYTDGILDDRTADDVASQVAEVRDPRQSLVDLYGAATANAGEDRDDVTMVLIARGEGTSHFDNDIVDSHEGVEEQPARKAPLLTSGIVEDHAFMQISGKATWIRSTLFFDAANAMLQDLAGLTIDLRDCALLDSTFLGTIHEIVTSHPDQVALQNVPDVIHDLFAELSMQVVIDRISVEVSPLPDQMEPLIREINEEEQQARLLKAHEVLSTLSDENEAQFRSVVALLKQELADQVGT